MYHNICFEQKYENSQKNLMKIVIFKAVKNRCILHGRVFILSGISKDMFAPETMISYEPRCEKTDLRDFRPGPTQTGLYSYRR